MKKYIGIFIVLLGVGQLKAQNPDTLLGRPILKIAPLSLIDPDNSLTVGIELPLKGSPVALQVELGYGRTAFNLWSGQRDTYPNRETWRARIQARYYFTQKTRRGTYLAVDYFFKQNTIRRWESVGQQCTNNGQCAFFEQQKASLGRFVSAINLKIGWQWQINRKLSLDVFTGIGIRGLNVRYISDSKNVQNDDFRSPIFNIDRVGSYGPYPAINLGFYVGYLL